MPRDGSNFYTIPAGTHGIPDQTIESAKYNSFTDDIAQDLNTPRPILYGGTGANSKDSALAALGAERSSQLVTNYDSHLYYPGTFYSASTATNAPINGHAFAGYVYSSDAPAYPPANLNLVVEARDLNDTVVPGRIYVREKKSGSWGPWKRDLIITDTGNEGISSASADMYFGVKGVSPASMFVVNSKADITGTDIFTVERDGTVKVSAGPVDNFDVATKKYVDDQILPLSTDKAPIASPTFTGDPKAPTPTAGDNDTSIATTAFVTAAMTAANIIHATRAEFYSNSAPTKIIDVGTMWQAAGPVPMTGSTTPNFDLGIDFYANPAVGVLANPTGTVKAGQKGVIWLIGGSVTSWGSAYKFPRGTKPTTTGGWDIISYVAWDANNIMCTFTGNHS